jgi:hypothetical protein
MQSQLFDDRYAPITSEIEFLDCDAKTASDAFQEWQQPIQLGRGVRLQMQEVHGDFAANIECLLPLTSVERRRFLFFPTASNWTAYLDNGWQGTDVSAVSYLSRKLGCRAIRSVSIPNTIRNTATGELGRYGATMLEVFASDPSSIVSSNVLRSISSANDGGRWRFDSNGQPFGFERLDQYKDRRTQERFTPKMLEEYLHHFKIRLFDPSFYEVQQPAYFITKTGPTALNLKEYSLDEARLTF